MIKNYIHNLSQNIFKLLESDEQLSLFLHSEESTFIRFSQSKVRQNTQVNQHELTLQFHKDQRLIKMCLNLTLNESLDLEATHNLILDARTQLPLTDANPQFFKINNNGHSEVIKKSNYPNVTEIPDIIYKNFSQDDLAGLWCSGPLRQASINSEGQFHFFETDFFFFDYSLYSGPLAAKGYYSEHDFSEKNFSNQAYATKNKLALLKKPVQKIPRGQYRVYLEPMAVAEILGTMSWGSFSQGNYKKGVAPLKKLAEKQLFFSPKVTMLENFELGLTPEFNSIGELSLPHIKLIEHGHLTQFLTSSATAQEFSIDSNNADVREVPRSLELLSGSMNADLALQKLNTGIYISNLHYINYSDIQSARITGMTRFACFWVENGEIVGPIQDLRFDESLYNIFGAQLVELTEQSSIFVDIGTYQKRGLGAMKVPGALIEKFNFTL